MEEILEKGQSEGGWAVHGLSWVHSTWWSCISKYDHSPIFELYSG